MFLGVPRLYDAFMPPSCEDKASIPAMVLFRISRYIGNLTLSGILFRKVQNAFGGNIHAYLTAALRSSRTRPDLRAWVLTVEGYGLTETASAYIVQRFDRIKPGSVGCRCPIPR